MTTEQWDRLINIIDGTGNKNPVTDFIVDSPEQHKNWIDSIISREETVAPAEIGHRSCSACLVNHIAMKLPGKLYWDPEKERFIDNDEANSMLSRLQRYPYGTGFVNTD